MSITYEEAVATLCAMFENWDRGTIIELFESNGYHVERTIETILSMDQPNVVSPPASRIPSSNTTQMEADAMLAQQLASEDQPRQRRQNHSQSTSGTSKRRGTPCTLPDDFLRLSTMSPSSVTDYTIGDEQLAIMLQDEMFRNEVRAQLGGDTSMSSIFRQQSRRPHTAAEAYNSSNTASTGSIPDMGILKGLQEMGDGMKQKLTQLAHNFNNRNTTASSSYPRSSNDEPESRSLLHQDVDYEEEDDEEIPLSAAARRQAGVKKDK